MNKIKFTKSRIGFLFLILVFTNCKKVTKKNPDSLVAIKYFNCGASDIVYRIEKSLDGGFIYCGSSRIDNWNTDAFMLKVDSKGNQEWYKNYGGKNTEIFNDAIQTSDGGFIAVGGTSSIGSGGASTQGFTSDYIIKTNVQGELVWEKSFLAPAGISMRKVIEMPDHSIIITGHKYTNNFDIVLLKLHPDGTYAYAKTFSTLSTITPYFLAKPYHEFAQTLILTNDGSILIGGVMDPSNSGADVGRHVNFMMKVEPSIFKPTYLIPDFNLRRETKLFNGLLPWQAANVEIINNDDGYLMGTYIDLPDAVKLQITKTNTDGTQQWKKEYTGLKNSLLFSMCKCKDGSTLINGASADGSTNFNFRNGFSAMQTMLLKIDKNGEVLWSNYFGSSAYSSGFNIAAEQSNGNFNIGGAVTDNETGYDKMYWTTIDPVGKLILK